MPKITYIAISTVMNEALVQIILPETGQDFATSFAKVRGLGGSVSFNSIQPGRNL